MTRIAPIYPKTQAGKAAPLRRVDYSTMKTCGSALRFAPHFTPTLADGRRQGNLSDRKAIRCEDFFWACWKRCYSDADLMPDPAKS